MKNIERSKLFAILGAVLGALLITAIVLIAIFMPKDTEKPVDTRTQAEQQKDNVDKHYQGENGDENSADILNPDNDPEAPPEGLYKNDFSKDTGYIKLKDHESAKSNPENTVYDDQWAFGTWTKLNCDLANKYTISEDVMKPMKQFKEDLTKVGSPMSNQLIDNVNYTLSKIENSRGERIPGDAKNIAQTNCDRLTVETGP